MTRSLTHAFVPEPNKFLRNHLVTWIYLRAGVGPAEEVPLFERMWAFIQTHPEVITRGDDWQTVRQLCSS